jgi:hypothetical protein
VHPASRMPTAMVRRKGASFLSTIEEGGAAVLRLITDPAVASVTGAFFDRTTLSRPKPQAESPEARQRLRELSDRLVVSAVLEQ